LEIKAQTQNKNDMLNSITQSNTVELCYNIMKGTEYLVSL